MNDIMASSIDPSLESVQCLVERKIIHAQAKIEHWFRRQFHHHTPPFYSSVDLRNSGYKLAPVDTNLFPAGFNNLSTQTWPVAVQAVQFVMERMMPGCMRMLLVPENHTRNLFYLESLKTLEDILQKAGFEVRIGSLIEDLTEPMIIDLPSGRQIHLAPLERTGNRIGVKGFDACIVLLNHDLSGGIPPMLQNIEQHLIPPAKAGWFHRLKSQHFSYYDHVCQEFAAVIDCDPWLINPYFTSCDDLDFMSGDGVKPLIESAELIFEKIIQKYQEYQIKASPYLVIKADAGTYGMGVMTIKHPAELQELNRKERTKMAASKGGQKIRRVLIQEGVYTHETYGGQSASAEPVVYMIGSQVVGGFYRIHQGKGNDENLNAPGMYFEPLAFTAPCNCPELHKVDDCQANRFYSYGVIARLAALAAAYELEGN